MFNKIINKKLDKLAKVLKLYGWDTDSKAWAIEELEQDVVRLKKLVKENDETIKMLLKYLDVQIVEPDCTPRIEEC